MSGTSGRREFWPGGLVRLALCLFVLLAPALARGAEWRAMPWHLVDYFYQLPPVERAHSLTMDVTVAGDFDGADKVFIAPLWGKIGSTSFYFGLQTHVSSAGAGRPETAGVIYSRWGAAERGDARAAAGGWDVAFTHERSGEGSFAGVRLPYKWTPGRYTFLLNSRAAAEGRAWLDLLMFDHQRQRWTDVGGLRFPDGGGRLYARPASFVEVYGRPPSAGGAVEKGFDVTFHPLVVNGNITALGGAANFDVRVPRLAEVRSDGAGVSVAVGGRPLP